MIDRLKSGKFWFHILIDVLTVSAVLFLIYAFIFDIYRIQGQSMVPTFFSDDRVLIEKFISSMRGYKPGDIVVSEPPAEPGIKSVKRVIAIEGDTVTLVEGAVYVNGEALEEPYLEPGVITKGSISISDTHKYIVPKDSYVVMGDNRINSTDSRSWGALHNDNIIGKVLVKYWPLN